MGVTKEELLNRLQELQIVFQQYEHPVVLTVEAQAQHVGHLKGALSKNLFLKDKKQRYYIVSALAETKVDLKVLSQRLGLGKGGLRMAPEEALAEILQVPLGCVTPFALVNETARHVSLLLDQGLKTKESCFFHPLSNDMSISLNAHDLDKFLNSIGKLPAYVDLEANPPVGKDHPPDLAALVPSDAPIIADPPQKQGSSQVTEKNQVASQKQGSSQVPEKNQVASQNQLKAVSAKPAKPSKALEKEKSSGADNVSVSYADPEKFVEEILEKTSSVILSELKEENIEKHRDQLAAMVSKSISKQLGLELKSIATIFKNTAYTEGFIAGNPHQPRRM